MSICLVCPQSTAAKYKCPSCRIPYCSLNCWNEHKTVQCSPVVEVKEKEKVGCEEHTSYNFPTEDTVPLDKLKLLEQNQELKNILCNRHLRDMLTAIDTASNPAAAIQQAMLEPIFVEFADECLKVIEPVNDSEN